MNCGCFACLNGGNCEEPKEVSECFNCGTEEDLRSHPDYDEDRLCKECLIAHWEEVVDDLEREMKTAKATIEELNNE